MGRDSENRGGPRALAACTCTALPGILLGLGVPSPGPSQQGVPAGLPKGGSHLLSKPEWLFLRNPALSVPGLSSFGSKCCPGRWPRNPTQLAATQPQSSSLPTTFPQSSTQALLVVLIICSGRVRTPVIQAAGSHSWVESLLRSSYFLAQRES